MQDVSLETIAVRFVYRFLDQFGVDLSLKLILYLYVSLSKLNVISIKNIFV